MRLRLFKKIYAYILVIISLGISEFTHATGSHCFNDSIMPVIGKPLPEFTIENITHFREKKVTLADFKGKWLMLDFWFTGCVNCIRSFPKVNAYQVKFKDQLDWVMVGLTNYSGDKNSKDVELLYEKYREKLALTMPAAYDSSIAINWEVTSMPRIFIVDPQGVLRYITDGRDLTTEKLNDLLEGEQISLYKSGEERPAFDPSAHEGIRTSKDTGTMIYYSLLTRWKGESQMVWNDFDTFLNYPELWREGFTLSTVHLTWLYNMAFFGDYHLQPKDSSYGKIYRQPILRIKDTSLFLYSYSDQLGKGLYNYQLFLPDGQIRKEVMMEAMQQDIKRAFNYQASVELVKVPVWKLVVLPGAKKSLMTKGGSSIVPPISKSLLFGFRAKNISVRQCITLLQHYLYETDERPCIDDTGITGNIDLNIEADLLNRESIIAALRTQGLNLVQDHALMKALVIRDAR